MQKIPLWTKYQNFEWRLVPCQPILQSEVKGKTMCPYKYVFMYFFNGSFFQNIKLFTNIEKSVYFHSWRNHSSNSVISWQLVIMKKLKALDQTLNKKGGSCPLYCGLKFLCQDGHEDLGSRGGHPTAKPFSLPIFIEHPLYAAHF